MSIFSTPDCDSGSDTPDDRISLGRDHSGNPPLDAAIQELLTRLESFADPHFEVQQMNLGQEEIVLIAAVLIQQWTMQLDGRQIAGTLLAIREKTAF